MRGHECLKAKWFVDSEFSLQDLLYFESVVALKSPTVHIVILRPVDLLACSHKQTGAMKHKMGII
jgi:hypothetical protein